MEPVGLIESVLKFFNSGPISWIVGGLFSIGAFFLFRWLKKQVNKRTQEMTEKGRVEDQASTVTDGQEIDGNWEKATKKRPKKKAAKKKRKTKPKIVR